ncbi:MAG: tRNA epoxyqueuosine(34) reductase QueG [Saccharospirillum sp.]|nr:tRNA epoxyqueuosine(34) reductase QueG [Saccharospirillum sp.]
MSDDTRAPPALNTAELAKDIKQEAIALGFQAVHLGPVSTEQSRPAYEAWLAAGYQGTMDWMTRNLDKRFDGAKLHPGARTAITVRMDYRPDGPMQAILDQPELAYVSRYALGRDYHKLMRKRLTELGKRIESRVGEHGYRAFVDSAPVMERQLAQQAGMGWLGKNTLLLNHQAGSWFFLGELFTNLDLPHDPPFETDHCGSCTRCLTVCPTDAFVDEGVLDARRCISYLTIEHDGAIDPELRQQMGNRIYGCDDCQMVCPFNRFSSTTPQADFQPRHGLDQAPLLELLAWQEEEFLKKTEGSAIRRIGYEKWQRNLLIAMGNAPYTDANIEALNALQPASPMVQEHLNWALAEQHRKAKEGKENS